MQFAGAHVELVGRGLAEKRVRHATLAMRERTAALQSLLDDCLLFGLAVIGAAVAYCGVWRGTRLMQCPELSDLPSFSMFTPFARMQRIGEVRALGMGWGLSPGGRAGSGEGRERMVLSLDCKLWLDLWPGLG